MSRYLTGQPGPSLPSHAARGLLALPGLATVCMAAIVRYLRDFKLDSVLRRTADIHPFSLQGTVLPTRYSE